LWKRCYTTDKEKSVCFLHKGKRVKAAKVVVRILHHMTRPGPILRGVQIYLRQNVLARVRIWVISTVTAPNKHISCKSCSSRTRPSVTATMIVLKQLFSFCFALRRKKLERVRWEYAIQFLFFFFLFLIFFFF
jgi:hypothetical protein